MSKSDDLISRQAAIDRINKQREHLRPDIYPQDKIGDAAYRVCAEFIERLPSAQPQRTGRWIYGEHDVAMCDGYWCDKCGYFVPWDYQHKFIDFIKDYHFCPNCGTKMEIPEDIPMEYFESGGR